MSITITDTFAEKTFPMELGANFVKLFLSVIYEFSHKDRVLVRICSKNFPRSNTLSYYKNSLIADKKVL
jgi:hypothetical protein